MSGRRTLHCKNRKRRLRNAQVVVNGHICAVGVDVSYKDSSAVVLTRMPTSKTGKYHVDCVLDMKAEDAASLLDLLRSIVVGDTVTVKF